MAVIPFVAKSDRIPFGVSKYANGSRLKFPLFSKRRRGYLIHEDQFVTGLWRFGVCIRTERSGFAVHWGWELVKEHHG
jgi:hypothetical protein